MKNDLNPISSGIQLGRFTQLWVELSSFRRLQLCSFVLLAIITSAFEIISIGAVVPFLGAITDVEKIRNSSILKSFHWLVSDVSNSQILSLTFIIFSISILVCGMMRLFISWFSNRIAYSIGHELSSKIYKLTLMQPYEYHTQSDSSELIHTLTTKVNIVIFNIIFQSLSLISCSIIAITILAFAVYLEPIISCSIGLAMALTYVGIAILTRPKKVMQGYLISTKTSEIIKLLQEGSGGVRDILLGGLQDIYLDYFKRLDYRIREAHSSNLFLNISPKYILETLGMLVIVSASYYLANSTTANFGGIAMMGAMALLIQKMLPLMQQIYTANSSIESGIAALDGCLTYFNLAERPQKLNAHEEQEFKFNDSIQVSNLSFKYAGSKENVISGLSFSIKKGERVAFVGSSGSGKSTILDLIMGLLSPTSGSLKIDGVELDAHNIRRWQEKIAHVSQSIFIANISVRENIAFGVPVNEIDEGRLIEVAKLAQIHDFIISLPYKYETLAGERGGNFSGGQRQRVAIARALYKRSDVIVLDEATSALDHETESIIMGAIKGQGMNSTLIIAAHRLDTLKDCTVIYKISDGVIIASGRFEDVLKNA